MDFLLQEKHLNLQVAIISIQNFLLTTIEVSSLGFILI